MLKLPYQVTKIENDSIPINIGPGYLSIQSDRDATGRWKDGNLVRFAPSSGLPSKVGGWVDVTPTNINANGFLGAARSTHEWQSLDRQLWLAVGTNSKLYIFNQGQAYDITPTRRQAALSNPFATQNGQPTIVVTDPNHGAFVGDNVTLSGFSTVAGLNLNGQVQVTAVTINTWTFIASGNANATTTGGGSGTATYDINSMAADATQLLGWSASTWGTPRANNLGWSSPASSSNIFAPVGMWSLANWGEDLIASPRNGAIYIWKKSTGPFTKASIVSANAPLFNGRVLVSDTAQQIIAFGSSTIDAQNTFTGPLDPSLIRWCSSGDYTTWFATAQNTAGSYRLSSGSGIVTANPTRGGYLVGTTSSAALFYPTGDTNVYSANTLGKNTRPCGPQASADYNGVTYTMCQDNFMVYDGVLRVMPCDVWNRVFDKTLTSSLNLAKAEKVVCHINRSFSEVWWHYPSLAGPGENDSYVVYNWLLNCWHYGVWSGNAGGDINRSAGHDYGDVFNAPYMAWYNTANGFSRLYQHETGTLANAQTNFGEFIESWDTDIMNSGQLVSLSHLLPAMKEFTGLSTAVLPVNVKIRKYQADAYKTKGPYSLLAATQKLSARAKGRQIAFRIGPVNANSSVTGVQWQMGTWRVKLGEDGDR